MLSRLEINKWRLRMRQLTADLFISLDGFASGVNQAAYFSYFGQNLRDWVRDQLEKPQVLLIRRATYVVLAHFSASATDELSVKMSSLPKLVFAITLKEPLSWKNTRLLQSAVADEIRALKQQPGDPCDRSAASAS
jgi:hypothetical protein